MGTETMLWLEPREVKKHLLLLTIDINSPAYNYINDIDGELTEEKIAEINNKLSEEIHKAEEIVESLRTAYDSMKRKTRNDFVYYYKYFTSRKGELDNLIKIKNYLQAIFDIKIDMKYLDDGFNGMIIKPIKEKEEIKIYLVNRAVQDKKFIIESYTSGSFMTEVFDDSLSPIPFWSGDDPTFLYITKDHSKAIKEYLLNRDKLITEEINQSNDFLKTATKAIGYEDLIDLKTELQEAIRSRETIKETTSYFEVYFKIIDQIESKENDFKKLLIIQG